MSIRGADIFQDTSGYEDDIVAAGYQAVCVHLRSPCSKEMIQGLQSARLNLWSAWGIPFTTDLEYLEKHAGVGVEDGLDAVKEAQTIGQPPNTLIFTYVECGMHEDGLEPTRAYFADFSRIVIDFGYLPGAYGPGDVCSDFADSGLSRAGWLAGYPWPGYEAYLPKAALIEELTVDIIRVRDLVVQPTRVVDPSVLWYPQGL